MFTAVRHFYNSLFPIDDQHWFELEKRFTVKQLKKGDLLEHNPQFGK